MRPERSFLASVGSAFKEGIRSASQNLLAMAALLSAMAGIVVSYYFCPPAAAFLTWYAGWQHAGGILRTGLASGFAGGILSELSLVYLRDRGRWNATHLENMAFRFVIFCLGGMIVSKFYEYQSYWFGDGMTWQVLVPKVLVDQFGYSVFWSTSYQTLTFRWQALRYSTPRLWSELDGNFVIDRMLPVLVTNWMFWIPGVTLVYSMPLILQMPLNIFATAIWSLLLAGLARPAGAHITAMGPDTILMEENPPADVVEKA